MHNCLSGLVCQGYIVHHHLSPRGESALPTTTLLGNLVDSTCNPLMLIWGIGRWTHINVRLFYGAIINDQGGGAEECFVDENPFHVILFPGEGLSVFFLSRECPLIVFSRERPPSLFPDLLPSPDHYSNGFAVDPYLDNKGHIINYGRGGPKNRGNFTPKILRSPL